MRLFVTCLPGLEPLLHAEMSELGLEPGAAEAGGVPCDGGRTTLYRANLELGLATAVLVRVGTFSARSLGELARKAGDLDWGSLLDPARPVAVDAVCRKSRLYHSGAVEQRVREGIAARLRRTPPTEGDGAQSVRVRLVHDQVTLSLDTSGEPLQRRGVRLDVGKAPLRHDLARALVVASGWDRASPLVDPFCGSGTIAIEAASLAMRAPPGAGRSFAFEQGPLFDEGAWLTVRAAARAKQRDVPAGLVRAGDRDAGAAERTRTNAERAGLSEALTVTRAAVNETLSGPLVRSGEQVADVGAVVTNPPYGKRLAAEGLRTLYQSFGHRVAALPDAWRVALLVTDRKLAYATGLRMKSAFLTDHGGLRVRAMVRTDAASPPSVVEAPDGAG